MIYLLLVTELALLGLSYFSLGKKIISVSFITFFVFLIATLCIIYNNTYWDVYFSIKAYLVVLSGFLIMYFAELCFYKINYQETSFVRYEMNKYESIDTCLPLKLLFVGVDIIAFFIYIIELIKSGHALGYSGLEMIGQVKYSEESFSLLANICIRYTQIVFYAFSFIFFYNFVLCKVKLKNIWYCLITIIVYFGIAFFTGNRANLIRGVSSLIIYYCLLSYIIKPKLLSKKMFLITTLIVALVIYVFYLSRSISKAGSYSSDRSFLEYITYYIGSPLYLFSKFLDNPDSVIISTELGQQSFAALYDFFGQKVEYINNFIPVGGNSNFAGNEFSWFQRPYTDFGFGGMLIFTFIIYGFNAFLLHKGIYRNPKVKSKMFFIVFFTYYSYVIVMSFYYCQVTLACNPMNLLYLMMVYLVIYSCKKIKG